MAEMACRSDRGRGGERAFTSRRVRKWTSWSWAESATTSATGPKARDKPSAEISGNQNRAMCSRDLGHASRMLGWLADSKADCPQEAQVSSVRHGRLRKPSGLDGSVLGQRGTYINSAARVLLNSVLWGRCVGVCGRLDQSSHPTPATLFRLTSQCRKNGPLSGSGATCQGALSTRVGRRLRFFIQRSRRTRFPRTTSRCSVLWTSPSALRRIGDVRCTIGATYANAVHIPIAASVCLSRRWAFLSRSGKQSQIVGTVSQVRRRSRTAKRLRQISCRVKMACLEARPSEPASGP